MSWILPRLPKSEPDPLKVRTHRLWDEHAQGKPLRIFYRGQTFRSSTALQAKFRLSKHQVDRLIFEGKAVNL